MVGLNQRVISACTELNEPHPQHYQDEEDQAYIDFGYHDYENDHQISDMDKKPRILLMGLHRSGKSSIQKVVFHKMSPSDTLFLESTNKIVILLSVSFVAYVQLVIPFG